MAVVVVTGASGFLGAHLVRALAGRGTTVVAADRARPPAEVRAWWAGLDVEFTELDVREPATVFADVRPDVVVHAAAVTNGEPEVLHEVNVDGTAAVLAAAGAARFVHVSSASVYEDSGPVLRETSPMRTDPVGYPASKIAAERLVAEAGGVIARVAACYGPLERNTGVRRVLSLPCAAVRAVLAGHRVAAAPDAAGCSFDPTWVGDVADGIAALAGAESLPHPVYNVGSGTAVTLGAFAAAVNEAGGARACGDPVFLELPPGHRTGVLDVTRLRELSGHEPTPLSEALSTYLGWLREHRY